MSGIHSNQFWLSGYTSVVGMSGIHTRSNQFWLSGYTSVVGMSGIHSNQFWLSGYTSVVGMSGMHSNHWAWKAEIALIVNRIDNSYRVILSWPIRLCCKHSDDKTIQCVGEHKLCFSDTNRATCVFLGCLKQCFSTAGPRPGTGPWRQLYRAAGGLRKLQYATRFN